MNPNFAKRCAYKLKLKLGRRIAKAFVHFNYRTMWLFELGDFEFLIYLAARKYAMVFN